MANYSIKLYDEELLSFSAEKFLDKISIKNIHANKDHLSLFPLDLQPTEDSILHWLRRRVIPKNRAFVGEIYVLSVCIPMMFSASSMYVKAFRLTIVFG